MGNFATLQDLPEMYRQCKATEDHDMTPLDFITDHLVNIDGLFDNHDQGDEQRPHRPPQLHHIGQATFSLISSLCICNDRFLFFIEDAQAGSDNIVHSDFISKVFRPPIA